MKRIVVPISFSKAYKNSLRYAASLYDKTDLTLLHTYPMQKHSRKYHFGKQKYTVGIQKKIIKFYHQHIEEPSNSTSYLVRSGATSNIIDEVSNRYDLMVMSRKIHASKKHGYFSDKKLFITTKAHCPVLIMPISDAPFNFKNCDHIWHIKRSETELEIITEGCRKLQINPEKMETKSLQQTNFLSAFWQNLVNYRNNHDKNLLKKIDEAHELEPIDLIILVDHDPSIFTSFFKSEVIHLFCKYNIPILVFPTK
jgi:hypothetical protein